MTLGPMQMPYEPSMRQMDDKELTPEQKLEKLRKYYDREYRKLIDEEENDKEDNGV
jgi:hypothetical protein